MGRLVIAAHLSAPGTLLLAAAAAAAAAVAVSSCCRTCSTTSWLQQSALHPDIAYTIKCLDLAETYVPCLQQQLASEGHQMAFAATLLRRLQD